MYEVPDIQDYEQKWLEAERDLAISWAELPSNPFDYEPIDKDAECAQSSKSFADLPHRA